MWDGGSWHHFALNQYNRGYVPKSADVVAMRVTVGACNLPLTPANVDLHPAQPPTPEGLGLGWGA